EQRRAGQGAERRAVAVAPAGRGGLVAAERLVGAGAEEVGDGVVGEAGGLQDRAQTKGQVLLVVPALFVVSRADRLRRSAGPAGSAALAGGRSSVRAGPGSPDRRC